jgi:hypothetical protein
MDTFFLPLLCILCFLSSSLLVVEAMQKEKLNVLPKRRDTIRRLGERLEPRMVEITYKKKHGLCQDNTSYWFNLNGVDWKCVDINENEKSQSDGICTIPEVKENCSKACGFCFEVSKRE